MKETPQEKELKRNNFEPGKIAKNGFLGGDARHIHDIIQADQLVLSQLGISQEQIADKLQYFLDEGKKGLETEIEIGHFKVKTEWYRGMLPCPFGEKRLFHKTRTAVTNQQLDRKTIFSQLNVHLIREHGFFGGKGSVYRLEPEDLVNVLELKSQSN